MAKYLVLIYGDEAIWSAWTQADEDANSARHDAFMAVARGNVLSSNPLEHSSTATSVRPDGAGQQLVTDGPFLETKEALGGYYLLEAADLDEAVALARQIPEASTPGSGVEVRPVRDMSGA